MSSKASRCSYCLEKFAQYEGLCRRCHAAGAPRRPKQLTGARRDDKVALEAAEARRLAAEARIPRTVVADGREFEVVWDGTQ